MAKLSSWIASFRLRTLPLSLSTIVLGSALAAYYHAFDWVVFILAMMTTLFLQVLSNLANDYGDGLKGTDMHRQGEKRMVQSGEISESKMKRAIVVCASLAFVSGISLLTVAFKGEFSLSGVLFLVIGLLAIGAAVKYTIGRNPYGYKGLGDLAVFIFFGLVGVLGTFYLHALKFHFLLLIPAIAMGLLSVAVLNVNNLRDWPSDANAGKRSLVVIYGDKFGKRYHFILIGLSFLLLGLFMFFIDSSWVRWIFLLPLPGFILHLKTIHQNDNPPALDPELKRLALLIFATVILFSVVLILML